MTPIRFIAPIATVSAVGAGCTSTAEYMQKLEPLAVQAAVNRGQFEMNCPSAAG